MNIENINKVFFIGIGGIGMSGLAKYFIEKGISVLGYDREKSFITEGLIKLGANVIYDPSKLNISEFIDNKKDTLIVYTSAISKKHPLLKVFLENKFKVYKRSEILQKISKFGQCIAIAGTHGKTTTTAILAHILKVADFSFCAFVGGIMENYNSNFVYNGEDFILVEADEFDRSFLNLNPNFACITSLDVDHLDIYEDSENLNKAFIEFKNNLLDGGFLISNEKVDIKSLKYGVSDNSDYIVRNIKCNSSFSQFDLHFNGINLENLKIKLQGIHNVMNSVAAVSIALKLGVTEKQIFNALDSFDGIERRFSYKIDNENIVLIDDYAHHPEEIKQVFKTLKSIYPNERLLVVFQPHLFSRTRDLLDEFANVLSEFDAVILLDIYPAREEPISGVSSEILLQKIKSNNKYLSKKSDLSDMIKNIGYKVNVTLGAGDIGKEVEQIKSELEYAV
jgi:UDP-N-acetylmuramate--alanine ligase